MTVPKHHTVILSLDAGRAQIELEIVARKVIKPRRKYRECILNGSETRKIKGFKLIAMKNRFANCNEQRVCVIAMKSKHRAIFYNHSTHPKSAKRFWPKSQHRQWLAISSQMPPSNIARSHHRYKQKKFSAEIVISISIRQPPFRSVQNREKWLVSHDRIDLWLCLLW